MSAHGLNRGLAFVNAKQQEVAKNKHPFGQGARLVILVVYKFKDLNEYNFPGG